MTRTSQVYGNMKLEKSCLLVDLRSNPSKTLFDQNISNPLFN